MDWYSHEPLVLQNPRHPLPAPLESGLLRGTLLFATSGSSGAPKWVAHTRRSLMASAAAVNEHLNATAADVWLRCLPEFHVGGMAIGARAELANSKVVEFPGKWNAAEFCEVLTAENVTLTALVPTQVHDLVSGGHKAPNGLRATIIGGGRLEESLYQAARALGWPLLPSYGLTEAASQVATAPLSSLQNAEFPALRVLSCWETRTDAEARLEIRGPALCHGYYRQDAAGMWQWENPFVDDWFRTADCVELSGLDTQRGLRWLGRADRTVKILGELVDVDALEARLSKLADAEVILFPIADERRGVRLTAVSPQPLGRAVAALHEQCAPFERIGEILTAPIQRSALGKPLRDPALYSY
jgi:O-succinylbenzoic acid--CoA ligase